MEHTRLSLSSKERYLPPVILEIQCQQLSVMMSSATDINGTLNQAPTPWTDRQYDIEL